MIKKFLDLIFGTKKLIQTCDERLVSHRNWVSSDEGLEFCKKNNMPPAHLLKNIDVFEIAYKNARDRII